MRNQRTDPHPHINFWVRSMKRYPRMTPGMLLGTLLRVWGYFLQAGGNFLMDLGFKLRLKGSTLRNAISRYEK